MILIYKNKGDTREIEGIKVVKKIKYLGLSVDDNIKMFGSQKEDLLTLSPLDRSLP